MKILLTGASSYVGARLYFDLVKNFDVVGTYNTDKLSKKFIKLDVTNKEEVGKIVLRVKPDIVIHAAANANARWCEANPKLAIKLNQESTQSIVDAANKSNAKVFLVSSYAAHNPTNVYGKTKHESEKLVKAAKNGYLILRPSLLIGFSPNTMNDRPFNRLLKNIDQGTEAIYDTSWKFQPSWLGHVSKIITLAIQRGISNETIPIAVEDLKTRYDIAKDILKSFNIQVKPTDAKDDTPTAKENLSKLRELQLPEYSYEDIILKCVNEIKSRDSFVLD